MSAGYAGDTYAEMGDAGMSDINASLTASYQINEMFALSAGPAPTMDELITWVVLPGPPSNAAPRMTAVLATCDEKACTARIR